LLDALTHAAQAAQWPVVVASAAGWGLIQYGAIAVYKRARGTAKRRLDPTQLRIAIEAMPEGLAFYDAEDRIVIWNQRYAELKGDGGGELKVGTAFRDLLSAGLKAGVYSEAKGREAEWLEDRLAKRRAGEVTLEQDNAGQWLRIIERRTPDGGTVSICEDITDLKKRESTLRSMFEESPAPMWVVDAETWRFLAVNEAAAAHYGYSRDRFLQMNLAEVYVDDDLPQVRAAADHTRASGTFRSPRAWRQRTADGSEILVRPFVNFIRYEGRPAFMAAQIDVTASQQAEDAMAQARDAAEAASRAKGEFLANMSHEIRTPLNGVTGVAQVLARSNLTPAQREMVQLIESSATTLERLLSDILDLSRVESGRVRIEAEPFDLAEAVRATAALSELRAREKGVTFSLDIAADALGAVVGDAGRLKQILFNLLGNAVKFTKTGGVSLTVSRDGSACPPVYSFEVRDTGVGFDPAFADRLFHRFEQEDGSITRQFGGSGLGLAISRDLAELMGGRLKAWSQPGEGSVFTLTLPLPRADEEHCVTQWEAAPAFLQEASRPLRVLLAEDHPTNQKVVQLMLATMDVELTCVDNGQEAVNAMSTGRFDLVLMDMQMPVMDGLSAIRLIRAREQATGQAATPVFTLSANAMHEHVEASISAGADRHLTKPITASVLLGAVAEIAEQVALQEAA